MRVRVRKMARARAKGRLSEGEGEEKVECSEKERGRGGGKKKGDLTGAAPKQVHDEEDKSQGRDREPVLRGTEGGNECTEGEETG